MIKINKMHGTIAEVSKELLGGKNITNYVDVENGVMYRIEGCDLPKIPVLRVLYNPDGKPKVFPKLEELQKLFEEKYRIKVSELYD